MFAIPHEIDPAERAETVCAILGIGRTKLYDLIKAGDFPAPIKFGKASRWPRSVIYSARDKLAANSR